MGVGKARATLSVAGSQIGCEGLGLLRNVILARLLGPSEMGVFATLAMTLSLLDMVSDLGPDRLLIQAEDGDREEFQATAQTLLVIRGLVCGVLLAGIAYPVANLLGNLNLGWMIAALGAVAAIRGFLHLDCKRTQRQHDFRSSVIAELASAGLTTAAVAVFANRVHDASAFVWISLLQVSVLVLASHVLSTRKYWLTYREDIAGRLFRFGWPLACNSLIMFGALQGDRLVVLASASAADLGRYAVAFQLTMVPTLLISRIASTLLLPVLSRSQSSPEQFAHRLNQAATILGFVSLTFTLSIMWAGNWAVGLLYGSAFQIAPAVMSGLAIMQGLRILRAVPSLTAMARADSVNPLAANVLRLTGIIAAAIVGLSGWGLEAIAFAGCGGEIIALIGSVLLLQWRHEIRPHAIWRASLLFAAGIIPGALALHGDHSMVRQVVCAGCAGGVVLWALGNTLSVLRSKSVRVSPAVSEFRPMFIESGH